jgi:hypothetical protein
MTCHVDQVNYSNPSKRRLLIGTFSIIYCVQGRIKVSLLGGAPDEIKTYRLSGHESLYLERLDSESDTREITCELLEENYPPSLPLNEADDNTSSLSHVNDDEHGSTSEESGVSFIVIDIFELPVKDLFRSNSSMNTSQSAIINNASSEEKSPMPKLQKSLSYQPMLPPALDKNCLVYDESPSWIHPPPISAASAAAVIAAATAANPILVGSCISTNGKGSNTLGLGIPELEAEHNLGSKREISSGIFSSSLSISNYGGALEYEPPYRVLHENVNESAVPPPEDEDTLMIENYPMGQISTVWISMMKHGLSEYIKIPVIIARGIESG